MKTYAYVKDLPFRKKKKIRKYLAEKNLYFASMSITLKIKK